MPLALKSLYLLSGYSLDLRYRNCEVDVLVGQPQPTAPYFLWFDELWCLLLKEALLMKGENYTYQTGPVYRMSIFIHSFIVCFACVQACLHAMAFMWRSEDSLQDLGCLLPPYRCQGLEVQPPGYLFVYLFMALGIEHRT